MCSWLMLCRLQYLSQLSIKLYNGTITASTPQHCRQCDWSVGNVACATNTCCEWLQQSETSTLSPVSPAIITASLLGYYSATLARLHWLPDIFVGVYFLMLFSSTYFIPEVAKTTSLYLGQVIIRADGLFDFYLDNTFRMLSESVNTYPLLVWLLSFESFVLVSFWKTGCCGVCMCLHLCEFVCSVVSVCVWRCTLCCFFLTVCMSVLLCGRAVFTQVGACVCACVRVA